MGKVGRLPRRGRRGRRASRRLGGSAGDAPEEGLERPPGCRRQLAPSHVPKGILDAIEPVPERPGQRERHGRELLFALTDAHGTIEMPAERVQQLAEAPQVIGLGSPEEPPSAGDCLALQVASAGSRAPRTSWSQLAWALQEPEDGDIPCGWQIGPWLCGGGHGFLQPAFTHSCTGKRPAGALPAGAGRIVARTRRLRARILSMAHAGLRRPGDPITVLTAGWSVPRRARCGARAGPCFRPR